MPMQTLNVYYSWARKVWKRVTSRVTLSAEMRHPNFNQFISLTTTTTMAPAGTTELSPSKRGQIIALRKAGFSYQEIAKRVGAAKSTCYKTVKRDELYHTRHSLPRSGRPRVLTIHDKRKILRTIRQHRFWSYRTIGKEAGGYSERQVRQTAREAGYRRYVARRKPYLSIATVRKRLQWAHQNLKRDWTQVIWTDETALRLGEVVTHRYVTRRPGEGNLPECVLPSFPTGSKQTVMVWGCIAHGRKGPLVRLDLPRSQPDFTKSSTSGSRGGLDAKGYVEQILKGPLLAFYTQMQDETGQRMLVVEDGAPAHKAKVAAEARSRLGIKQLTHPPSSPDLNPIEPLWFKLKKRVQDTPGAYKSLDSLWEAAKAAWEEMPDEAVGRQTSRMRARVKAVLRAHGRHTKF